MNAKLCKSLRRLARLKTIGRPMVEYYSYSSSFLRGKVRVSSGSTRGVYIQLKKAVRLAR